MAASIKMSQISSVMQFLIKKKTCSEGWDSNVKMVTEEEWVHHSFSEENWVGSRSNTPDWPVREKVSCESQQTTPFEDVGTSLLVCQPHFILPQMEKWLFFPPFGMDFTTSWPLLSFPLTDAQMIAAVILDNWRKGFFACNHCWRSRATLQNCLKLKSISKNRGHVSFRLFFTSSAASTKILQYVCPG